MRDPERIDRILSLIKAYWNTYPDLRLGQMLSNLAADNEKRQGIISVGQDPFYLEDEELEETLRYLLRAKRK